MFEIDLCDLNGYSHVLAQSVSPYSIKVEGFDGAPAERQYTWSETDTSPGASLLGGAPARNVERTVPIFARARFTSALTNVLTNPRPYDTSTTLTGWATQGTGSTVTYDSFECAAKVVTTGSADSGIKHDFTGTVAAYSAGVWVKTASGTAPISFAFNGETTSTGTATTTWQFFSTENKTLTAATRSVQLLQTDTGSRTLYVRYGGAHLGSTYAGFFDGACGDAAWTGTAHASTSTAMTSQDAVSRAIGLLGEKGAKAVAVAGIGGLTGFWTPKNSVYRNKIQVRAVDVSKVDYDWSHTNTQTASAEVRLTCHPYYKSAEVTATLSSATKAIGVGEIEATITGVKGDVPSPCRVVWTQGSNRDCRFVSYGIHGREYDAGNSLTLAAGSFGTSGYSGTLASALTNVQTLTKSGTISGGTWSLSWEGYTLVSGAAHNASTATIQGLIDAALGTANLFVVSGNPLSTGNMVFTAGGTLASQSIPQMVFSSSLTGGGTVSLSTTTVGRPAHVTSALYSTWSALCDTGNLTHVGDYEVWARVRDDASSDDLYKSSLRLKWSVGDLANVQQNDPATPQAVGDYSLVCLGQVHIPATPTGTQRWSGIIEGKTSGTAGNTIRVVRLRFKPIGTGSGEVRSVSGGGGALSMTDVFGSTSGALTGDTSTSGQTWASAGGVTDADDLTETAAPDNAVIRTAVSDTSTDLRYGRGVVLGSSTPSDVTVTVTTAQSTTATFPQQGVLARFVDNDNFLAAVAYTNGSSTFIVVYKFKGGTKTTLALRSLSQVISTRTVSLAVRASGLYSVSLNGVTLCAGLDADLGTAGVLASGKSGIIDWHYLSTACTRTYSDFSVSIPAVENIACYASQDLEFRTNEVLREISAGSVYGAPAIASQPFQPELTPAGAEGLTNRILVQTSRFNPDLGPDTLNDPGSLAVYYEPTWSFARSVS